MFLSSLRRARIKRRVAILAALAFVWSFVFATPAQLMAQSALRPQKRLGVRALTEQEMERIVGSHLTSVSYASGSTYPWEGSVGGTNTGNGNKQTAIPIVGWTARGGMPVSLSLVHNSQSPHNSELGYKWTHSYDIYLVATSGGGGGIGIGGGGSPSGMSIHWGDDLSYFFTQNVDGSYSAPPGIHDTLLKNRPLYGNHVSQLFHQQLRLQRRRPPSEQNRQRRNERRHHRWHQPGKPGAEGRPRCLHARYLRAGQRDEQVLPHGRAW